MFLPAILWYKEYRVIHAVGLPSTKVPATDVTYPKRQIGQSIVLKVTLISSVSQRAFGVLEIFSHALSLIPGLTSVGILPGMPQFFFFFCSEMVTRNLSLTCSASPLEFGIYVTALTTHYTIFVLIF